MSTEIRRKCFISYHHVDEVEVKRFIDTFDTLHNLFIHRILGTMNDDIVNSMDTDYVMSRIRSEYLKDSTVTIVLVGRCTWARRYIDWEIQSSLRQGAARTPNGLLGIVLPSAVGAVKTPERLQMNRPQFVGGDAYARLISYPTAGPDLFNAIEQAFQRRTIHARLIKNPRERMHNNRQCP